MLDHLPLSNAATTPSPQSYAIMQQKGNMQQKAMSHENAACMELQL